MSLRSRISLVFLPLKCKKSQTDQSIRHVFYIFWKETTHKLLKWQMQKSFFPVCMLLVQLTSMNVFILCDNCEILLFVKVHRYSEIFLTAMLLLSLKPVFWKKFVFMRYLHSISTMLIPKSQSKADNAS